MLCFLAFIMSQGLRLHQVFGSSNYDNVMTKQVPGVSGANFVGRHIPSVPDPYTQSLEFESG